MSGFSLPTLSPGVLLAAAVTAAAAGLWLALPRGLAGGRDRVARWIGGLLGALALAGFVVTGRRLGGVGEEVAFLAVSLVAVVAAAATIVSRSPVYAAIWFALALLGVAGVLLVLGAQFLGVATIVVYAGAILVMFLFVLMLAQPTGMAPYDRVSNEPLLSAVAGAVMLGLLSLSIGRLSADPSRAAAPAADTAGTGGDAVPPGSGRELPSTGTSATPDEGTEAAAAPGADTIAVDQVAKLGGELFGRHLLAVEVAGVLLLVALVGSIAIVSRAGDHSGELAPRGSAR